MLTKEFKYDFSTLIETSLFLLYNDLLKTHDHLVMQVFVRLLVLALPSICLDEVRELTPNIQRIEFQVLSIPTLLVKLST